MTPATRGRAAIASRVCVVSSLTLSCSNTALVIRRDTSSCTAGSFASGATMARYLDSSSSVDRDQLARADSGASRAATRSSTMAPAHRPRPGRLGRAAGGGATPCDRAWVAATCARRRSSSARSSLVRSPVGAGDGSTGSSVVSPARGSGTGVGSGSDSGTASARPRRSASSPARARASASASASAWRPSSARTRARWRGGGSAWGWARWACCSWSSSSGGPVRHPDAVGRGGPRQAPRQFPTVGRFGRRLVTQRG